MKIKKIIISTIAAVAATTTLALSVFAEDCWVGGFKCTYYSSNSGTRGNGASAISANPNENTLSTYVESTFTVINKTTGRSDTKVENSSGTVSAMAFYYAPSGYTIQSIASTHIFNVNGFTSGVMSSNT